MTAVGLGTGTVAGLVGITPGAGFVAPMAALAIGAASACASFVAVRAKGRLRVDDALDVFGVHGVSGLLGAVLTGLLASRAVNEAGQDGSWGLAALQLMACVATMAYSAGVSWGLLRLLGLRTRLRVDEQAEWDGTDLSQHGERGYPAVEVGTQSPVHEAGRPARAEA